MNSDTAMFRARKNAKMVALEEGLKLDVLGDDVRVVLSSADTGGSLALVQQRSLPGAGIPLHQHTYEDEIFQVLEGRVEFQVGGRIMFAEPGTTVFAPKQVPHSFRVVGTEPALLQIIMMPGGLEKMIEDIIRLPGQPDSQQL